MKKKIENLVAISIVFFVLCFSLVQLTTPVVRAQGCPQQTYIDNCSCNLIYGVMDNHPTRWYCYYSCTCVPTGGGEPMEIEREVVIEENP
jgi:hypothetical protein